MVSLFVRNTIVPPETLKTFKILNKNHIRREIKFMNSRGGKSAVSNKPSLPSFPKRRNKRKTRPSLNRRIAAKKPTLRYTVIQRRWKHGENMVGNFSTKTHIGEIQTNQIPDIHAVGHFAHSRKSMILYMHVKGHAKAYVRISTGIVLKTLCSS